VNTGELKLLLGKSKASINGPLAPLLSETVPVSSLPDGELIQMMPFLVTFQNAARQWTMRKGTAAWT
jgi:hypothetical protein